MDHFSNKTALITGGASGMGAATAREFVKAGGHAFIIDINKEGAQKVASESDRISAIVGDVSHARFCEEAVQQVLDEKGRLDVLVNAAGIILRANAPDTTDEAWQRMLDVNVNGVFFMSRAAISPMRAQGKGAIVNFGSIWGGVGAAGVLAYCASKGAVHQITRAMALDHVEEGIRINAVCPGEVDTPMLRSGRTQPPTEADMQALADSVPMKRLAAPEEIAKVVCFLASDEASYMTGAMVPVDAGYTAR